nr:hypothetical protein Prevot99_2240 [uncultured Prevotella sp.]
MKYVNTGVVFQEIPDEVTLSINISNCPCHCKGCHSKYLWEDIGEPLTATTLNHMIEEYGTDITCICFMGGDGDVAIVNSLAQWMRMAHPEIRIGWYSGRTLLAKEININNFDYIKLGPYIEAKGGLNKETTNQRLFKVMDGDMTDITNKFWKKNN